MLEVQNKNNILVVDSRLVAEELGIQHTTFKDTISKYTEKLESLAMYDFEPMGEGSSYRLMKETAPRNENGSGGITYFLLNEDQAVFLTTLSQNTPKVVEAKFNLVRAFSSAKQALIKQQFDLAGLINVIQNMHNELTAQRQQMNILTERTQRLDAIDKASQENKGCGNIIKKDAEKSTEEKEDLISAFEYLRLKKFGYEQANRLARRASTFSKIGIGNSYIPPKNDLGHLIFHLIYLDEAFDSITNAPIY